MIHVTIASAALISVPVTPMGKEDNVTAAAASAANMQFIRRTRPLRARHTDAITIGPRKAPGNGLE